jgi:UDP-MurNAc hydroxylase
VSLRVTYFYSACVRIESPNLRVLCDPWFTEGAYDGSWHQFPRLPNPLERLGRADVVYISHIHPDHYDPVFLRQYLSRYPTTELLIADFQHNHLLRKMRRDGFEPMVGSAFEFGPTKLDLLPNEDAEEPDPNDVDSALVVRYGSHSVVNMNDNAFNPGQIAGIRELCGDPDIALLGYTGAGPYPQTYYADEDQLRILAERKKLEFFDRYARMRAALSPKLAIPFAGKYVLGGKLVGLNEFRGVADAVEVLRFDPKAVVLADGGDASVDTTTLVPTRTRSEPYSPEALEERLAQLQRVSMTYECFTADAVDAEPLLALSKRAYENALKRSNCETDYFFCFELTDSWLVVNANRLNPCHEICSDPEAFAPRSEVSLEPRHFFGLLEGVFHWNNAEIGSHLRVRRTPDTFNRKAQQFLNFFRA